MVMIVGNIVGLLTSGRTPPDLARRALELRCRWPFVPTWTYHGIDPMAARAESKSATPNPIQGMSSNRHFEGPASR